VKWGVFLGKKKERRGLKRNDAVIAAGRCALTITQGHALHEGGEERLGLGYTRGEKYPARAKRRLRSFTGGDRHPRSKR